LYLKVNKLKYESDLLKRHTHIEFKIILYETLKAWLHKTWFKKNIKVENDDIIWYRLDWF